MRKETEAKLRAEANKDAAVDENSNAANTPSGGGKHKTGSDVEEDSGNDSDVTTATGKDSDCEVRF